MKKNFKMAESGNGVVVKSLPSVEINKGWLENLFRNSSKARILPSINGSKLNELGQGGLLGHIGKNLLPVTRLSRGVQGYIIRLPQGYKFHVPENTQANKVFVELEWIDFKRMAGRDANRSRIALLRNETPGSTDVAFVPKEYLDALYISVNAKEAKVESRKPGDLRLIEGGAALEHTTDMPQSAI